MVLDGYWQKVIEKGFSSTDGEGKWVVGVRRPAKIPELKENIEPLTVQGQGIYTFSREPGNTFDWCLENRVP